MSCANLLFTKVNQHPACRSSSSSLAPGPWITSAACLYHPQPSLFCVFCLFLYFLSKTCLDPGFFRKTAVVNPVPVKLCCIFGKRKQEESLCDPIPFPNSKKHPQSGWALERTHIGDPIVTSTALLLEVLFLCLSTSKKERQTGNELACAPPTEGEAGLSPAAPTSCRLCLASHDGYHLYLCQHRAKDGQAVVDSGAIPTAREQLFGTPGCDFDALSATLGMICSSGRERSGY